MQERVQQSPFWNFAVTLEESMTLDSSITGETVPSSIVMKESLLIIDSGLTLTIGEGKTLIPSLYKVSP